jgi:4-hydroxybenzoyl-CoA thioesterase
VPDFRAPAHELAIECGDDGPAGTAFYPRSVAPFDAMAPVLLEAAPGRACAELIRHHAILGWPMVDARAEFHAPCSIHEHLRTECETVPPGRSSFEILPRVVHADRRCVIASDARARSAHGVGGRPTIVAVPVPSKQRAVLADVEKE